MSRDYRRIWKAADEVVFSTTLGAVDTPRTALVKGFDADAIRQRKATAAPGLSIGGPTLAARGPDS